MKLDITRLDLRTREIDRNALRLLSKSDVERYNIFPVDLGQTHQTQGQDLIVTVSSGMNIGELVRGLNTLNKRLGRDVNPTYMSSAHNILWAIKKYYG
jgi:ABC-type phosphonate transport system ATPase subunit